MQNITWNATSKNLLVRATQIGRGTSKKAHFDRTTECAECPPVIYQVLPPFFPSCKRYKRLSRIDLAASRSTGDGTPRHRTFPPAANKDLSPTSAQGVQAQPVRPAQSCQHTMKNHEDKSSLSLGDIYITKRADAELDARAVTSATLLERYVTGDWSNLLAQDIKANWAAIHDGGRILDSYRIAPTVRIWIITEADRASTTILLPDEY